MVCTRDYVPDAKLVSTLSAKGSDIAGNADPTLEGVNRRHTAPRGAQLGAIKPQRREEMRVDFDTKTCSRCGGSGHYSFNTLDGTVCYGCNGSGKQLTPAGKRARAAYETAMTIPARDVKAGMVIMSDELSGKRKRRTVEAVGPSTTVYASNNDGPLEYIELRLAGSIRISHNVFPHTPIRLAVSPETYDKVRTATDGIKGVTVTS